jgi:hypothetical protein
MAQPMAIPGRHQTASVCGYRSLGSTRYFLLVVCVAAQVATLTITWPLWEVRNTPAHLPAVDLLQMPFGWLLVLSLAVVLLLPRIGSRLYLAVLLASFVFDQYRIQPQVIGTAILMIGVVENRAREFARWYLVALWFWSGLHKLLSVDWLGHVSWGILATLSLESDALHIFFAYAVAFGEMALGLTAILRPRWAAIACILLHVGIAALLSPWVLHWNFSVIPWNLCTAVVGAWLMWTWQPSFPRSAVGWGMAALVFLSPVGFYLGWVDPAFAYVLYSDNVPRGLITSDAQLIPIKGWGSLQVPFPAAPRLLRQYFDRTAKPNSKLHIADPRPWLEDTYFWKRADGATVQISRQRFLTAGPEEIAGVELDNPRSIFALSRAGARMLKRTEDGMIYAVEIPSDRYDASLLDHLHGLPNLEQLQLAGCPVTDDDLRRLETCDNLWGIGLNATKVTDSGVLFLTRLPKLQHFELEDTNTSVTMRQLVELKAD